MTCRIPRRRSRVTLLLFFCIFLYLQHKMRKNHNIINQLKKKLVPIIEARKNELVVFVARGDNGEINTDFHTNEDFKMRQLKIKMDREICPQYNPKVMSYIREKRFLMQSTLHVFPSSTGSDPYQKILPSVEDPINDRIYEQLQYVPHSYTNNSAKHRKLKTIYLHGGMNQWFIEKGQKLFLDTKCKVNQCAFTYDGREGRYADVVVFGNPYQLPNKPPFPRYSNTQIWMMSALETPPHTSSMKHYRNYFNWTMSYRTDSIIVSPYFKYESYSNKKEIPYKNNAQGKKKKVAWFVTNLFNVESGRMEYAKELQKYIDVDIYGSAGRKKCHKKEWDRCRQMIKKHYKFYLAFENSKCKDYLTEKVQTGLLYDAIPIVLGAATWEYANALPAHSYIDVEDFKSPKDLAEYLHKLDNNDELFNEYFKWKSYGTFIETKPWCRVCSMLHDDNRPAIWYDDLNSWWHAKSACIKKDIQWWHNVTN